MKATSYKVRMVNQLGVIVGCCSQTAYSPGAAMLAAEAHYPQFAACTAEPLAPFDYSCVGGMMASRNGDRLSRAASAVRAIRQDHAVGAEMDAGFDAGEFSGPAHVRAEAREIADALAKLGFTPKHYNDELQARGCGRFAYMNDLLVDAD
jgi:hypothetical protein